MKKQVVNLISVWRALFFRETLTRLFSSRLAWFWLIIEPIVHILFFSLIFSAFRINRVSGIDTFHWLFIGVAGYFVFQRTMSQTMRSVSSNLALFVYRQIKPIDTVFTRAILEILIAVVVIMISSLLLFLFDFQMNPSNLIGFMAAFVLLWLLGLSVGLFFAVITGFIPDMSQVIDFLMRPLYFLSGVLLPITNMPKPYREILMYNPIANAIESARFSFSNLYVKPPELDYEYLIIFVMVSFFLGLTLLRHFSSELVMQ